MEDFLQKLQAARSDEERDWLVLEFNLERLNAPLREVVWAAAVPHWFDQSFLSHLITEGDIGGVFGELIALSFVEPFPGRGYNIHERSRSLLLKRLWQDQRPRAVELSRRAAEFCAQQGQDDISWRIETLYHQLMAGDADAVESYVSQGIGLLNDFRFNEAEALARSVLGSMVKPSLDIAVAWAHFFQARLYHRYDRYRESIDNLEQALTTAAVDPFLAANSYLELGANYRILGDCETARSKLETALPLFHQLEDHLGEANCLRELGDINYILDDYEAAKQNYEEALRLFREVENPMGEATVLLSFGHVHRVLGENDEAKRQYGEAREVFRQLGREVEEANCLRSLGEVSEILREHETALQYCREALAIYEKFGDLHGEGICRRSLGGIDYSLENYKEAREQYAAALSISERIGDKSGVASSLRLLADIDIALGDNNRARDRYREALAMYRQIGDRFREAYCIMSLGRLDFKTDDYKVALEEFEEARKLFHQIGQKRQEAYCRDALEGIRKLMKEG
jgi:tetratricopeptide (TPR) repeat protein